MNLPIVVCADEPRVELEGVVAFENLCESPAQLANQGLEAERMVLVLHEKRYDLAEVQMALRSVGIDPLGAQVLDVPTGSVPSGIDVPLAGLHARALAYQGSEPEHAKPVPRSAVTRRSLFHLPQPVYLAAPLVDHDVCGAADGCQACADSCPRDAYRWHQGRIHFNKDICEPCGICVTTCPTEAISNPTATPQMLQAQIEALLNSSDEPVGLRFVCSRASRTLRPAGWHDVQVPCSGMVPGTWLITALLLGAAAVSLPGCSTSGCPLALDAQSGTAADFARSALAVAGIDAEKIQTEPAGEPHSAPVAQLDLKDPFTRAGNVATMLALNELATRKLELTHKGTSHGVVSIDAEACTLCAQCAQTCPTNAIAASYDGTSVSLSFEAASCTYCRQCEIACPEIARDAISVSSTVDAGLLASAPVVINQGTVLVCESCGKPIAPSSMMDRIGELLGDDFDDTMSYLNSKCLACRSLS